MLESEVSLKKYLLIILIFLLSTSCSAKENPEVESILESPIQSETEENITPETVVIEETYLSKAKSFIEVVKNNRYKKNVAENMLEVSIQDIEPYILQNINYESIVNKCNRLPDDYVVENRIIANHNGYRTFELEETAGNAWNALNEEALENDIYYVLMDGFRTPEDQQYLFDVSYEVDPEWAYRYIAGVRHSEHEMGLAVDVSTSEGYPPEDFYETREGIFLRDNAHKYGFILRYPEGKEDITGINYESWHYRYVGPELAQKLYEEDLALEEYYNLEYEEKE